MTLKKCLSLGLLLAALLAVHTHTAAQNIQETYDVRRGHPTTTLEMFKSDKWGSTFFFVDIYHTQNLTPTDFYAEISRNICLWPNSALANWGLHVEWNGGCGIFPSITNHWEGYAVNNAWLFGLDYTFHNADFSNTLTLQALYKDIRGGESHIPMQLTAVWTTADLFGVSGLEFIGSADFWWERHTWNQLTTPTETQYTFSAEPQLWYNIGHFIGCDNLLVGGEIEIDCHLESYGWAVYPAAGVKWNF